MKTNWTIYLLSSLLLAGCMPKDFPPNNSALRERFHGKYQAISSISREPLDVNMDGRASVDMIQEIPALANNSQSYLELRLYGTGAKGFNSGFLFTQWWPEQSIWVNDKKWDLQPIAYDPDLIVNYGMDGAVRFFLFAQDKLVLDPDDYDDNLLRWKRPDDITVVGEHRIRVINKKILYTRNGVKEVVITTVYERYTTIT